MQSKRMVLYIFAAMILGIIVGAIVSAMADRGFAVSYVDHVTILSDVFLRLIKMIIAPLVFSTLVVGIAHMGDSSAIGRIGLKTFGWFVAMSFISLLLGLLMVQLLQPGAGATLAVPDAQLGRAVEVQQQSLHAFVTHIFPTSVVDAMARNEILQIVVFAVFFGVAGAAFRKQAEPLFHNLELLSQIMLRVTTAIMNFAPFAVFAAVSAIVAESGLGILLTYAKFILCFYLSIGVLWLVIMLAGGAVLGRSVLRLLGLIREPVLLAFSTASSEAAYPLMLESVEEFGCDNKIASFVLPIGYSFNLDGSMMYCTFAALFIAQVYGIEMTLGQQFLMLLMLMVTSKGMAGVPRASLVVIAAILPQFNIPEAGLVLILGVDHFLDMARSATNVLGNGVATAVIAKSENALRPSGSA